MNLVKISLFLVLFLAAGVASAQDEGRQLELYSEFRMANDLFRQANAKSNEPEEAKRLYAQAVLHYERLIKEEGIRNGQLYYNLGNAYLLKGDVGRAILNYRRAERLNPSDADLAKNLSFARGKRIDKVEVKAKEQVLKTLFFWHYDFSIAARFLAACVFFGVLFLGLTVLLWFGRKPGVVFVCGLSGLLFLCFMGSVVFERVMAERQVFGVIVAESVIARHGDGENYPARFKEPLHSGTEFELVKRHPGWLHIELPDGTDGWVPEQSAELL